MLAQPFGVTARLPMLLLGDRCFRHQGTESRIVGLVGKLNQLLFGDTEVVARQLESFTHASESALDLDPRHVAEHRLAAVRSLRWILAAVLLLSTCSSGNESVCTELREPEDPTSDRHIVGNDRFEYLTHPPTSGPHVAGPVPSGVLTEPVPPALQVRLLEAGGVMVQYDPSVDAADLLPLADDRTVVAPGDELPAPVIATAWTWKLSCAVAAIEQIERFADARRLTAPGLD